MGNAPSSRQQAFAAALLDPDRAIPDGLVTPAGQPAGKRFGIYRNNVTVSLVSALSEVFPTVQNLVGEDFFRAMARLYVQDNPPTSRLLFEYGATFPSFIEQFEPAAELPFLADVARLERLWLDSFHEADAAPLDGAVLQRVAPEQLAGLTFVAHPATRLFRASHAAVTIMARDRAGEPLDGLDPFVAEDGLVTRPAYDPEIRHLPPGGADFIGLLIEGRTLGEAAGAALAADPDFNLPAAISAIIEAGAFSKILFEGLEVS
ncbi:HvfC/BufC N-terminal domain-containing protein [Rhizobium sp. C4]|uniref:HvfC/BufC N-terminal domain-containing protein n=1 Tax=Rhizobium sp. C4 TaxID=1349800 RepID=UPI001E504C76|nr:DNA-binding domain-containing protein [Rhizobium sp. C4]MCD2174062.1 DNA-binding domain-containing protein [Rhizobium sp. C4]